MNTVIAVAIGILGGIVGILIRMSQERRAAKRRRPVGK